METSYLRLRARCASSLVPTVRHRSLQAVVRLRGRPCVSFTTDLTCGVDCRYATARHVRIDLRLLATTAKQPREKSK